jgi:hypothetical protein
MKSKQTKTNPIMPTTEVLDARDPALAVDESVGGDIDDGDQDGDCDCADGMLFIRQSSDGSELLVESMCCSPEQVAEIGARMKRGDFFHRDVVMVVPADDDEFEDDEFELGDDGHEAMADDQDDDQDEAADADPEQVNDEDDDEIVDE